MTLESKIPNRTKSFSLAIALMLGMASSSAFATKFANQFSEFELPPQWQCNLEGAEWVCQNTVESKKRDAIIVLAAKLKGDQDSLDQYLAYLKSPKFYTSVQGKPVKSESKYAKIANINGQAWVDSLHLESEIPGFYTRYLATIKQDIGVLVTYSINKNKYQEYVNDFENMVKTLRVFRKEGGINAAPANSNLFSNAQVPQAVSGDTVFPGVVPQGAPETQAPPPPKPKDNSLIFILGGAAVLVLLLVSRKKKD